MNILIEYWPLLSRGILTTLALSSFGWVLGIFAGILFATAGYFFSRFGKAFHSIAFVINAFPILIIMVWMHYPAQSIVKVSIPPFYTAALCLILHNTLASGVIILEALDDFPRELITTGRMFEIPELQLLKSIAIPIVLRQTLPSLLYLQVQILHFSMLASFISVDELFRIVQQVNMREFSTVFLYTAAALLYFSLSFPLLFIARVLKSRFANELSLV